MDRQRDIDRLFDRETVEIYCQKERDRERCRQTDVKSQIMRQTYRHG